VRGYQIIDYNSSCACYRFFCCFFLIRAETRSFFMIYWNYNASKLTVICDYLSPEVLPAPPFEMRCLKEASMNFGGMDLYLRSSNYLEVGLLKCLG
jgi:hypothetical protein